jgi:hypothetical protein
MKHSDVQRGIEPVYHLSPPRAALGRLGLAPRREGTALHPTPPTTPSKAKVLFSRWRISLDPQQCLAQ